MSFGWSVGDIIAGIELVSKIGKALQEVGGAADDYQESATSLKVFEEALQFIQTFAQSYAGGESIQAASIEKHALSMKNALTSFLSKIDEYEGSLGASADRKWFHHPKKKIKWAFFVSKEVDLLKSRTNFSVTALQSLQQQLQIDIASTTRDKVDNIQTLLQNLQITLNTVKDDDTSDSAVDDGLSGLTEDTSRLALDVADLQNISVTTEKTAREVAKLREEVANANRELHTCHSGDVGSNRQDNARLVQVLNTLCGSFAQMQGSLQLIQQTPLIIESFQKTLTGRLDQLTLAVDIFVQRKMGEGLNTPNRRARQEPRLNCTIESTWDLASLLDEPRKRSSSRTLCDWRLDASFNWTGMKPSRYIEFGDEGGKPWEKLGCQSGARVGRGGFGCVSHFRVAEKDLVLKLVPRGRRHDLADHVREAIFLGKVSHHHIIQIMGAFTTEKDFGMILNPFAEGGNLHKFLQCSNQSTRWTRIVLSNIACLAGAIAFLHSEEVSFIHRDIKPTNVLVHGNSMLLADFGITAYVGDSLSTRPAVLVGTPAYMSPEVIYSASGLFMTGTASDIWSLGIVFWQMMGAVNKTVSFYEDYGGPRGWTSDSIVSGFRASLIGLVDDGVSHTMLEAPSGGMPWSLVSSSGLDQARGSPQSNPPTREQSTDGDEIDSLSVTSTDSEARHPSFNQYFDVEQDNCFDEFLRLMLSVDWRQRPNANLVHAFFRMPEWHGLFCGDCCAPKGSRADRHRYRPLLQRVKAMHRPLRKKPLWEFDPGI